MNTNIKAFINKFMLFFFLFASSLLNAEIVTGKCVGVTDGDTATVLVDGNRQVKVRFHGIDAPESSQDFGQRSKQKMSDLIYGKEVKVDILERDKYGRSVAKVYVGGVYTNLEMVKSGLAWHYVQYAPNDSDLASAEKAARASKVGLWSHANPTPPWNWRKGIGVYDNTSEKSTGKSSNGSSSGKASSGASGSGAYWVSGSGKVHNKSCRYYGSSNAGTYTDNPSGTDCKVCGGDGSSSLKVQSGKGSKKPKTVKENTTGGKYWITGSTGKTHRRGCRWYGTTQSGHYSDRGSGDNCKKCGGAGR